MELKLPPTSVPDPWPLVVRLTGGRLDHRARRRLTKAGRPTPWVDLACGGSCLASALDNVLREVECTGCGRRAEQDRHPDDERAAAAERHAQRAADHGQYPLPFLI